MKDDEKPKKEMLNVLFGEYLSDIILLDRNKSMGIDDIIKKILELNGNRFVEFKDRENKEDLFKNMLPRRSLFNFGKIQSRQIILFC